MLKKNLFVRLKNNYKHLDQEDNTLEKCKAEMRVNMGKDNVIQILDYYKNIDKEIKFNNVIIEDLEEGYNYIGSSATDNIRYDKNKITKTTEKTALNIGDTVRETLSMTEEQNKNLSKLKIEIFSEVSTLNYIEKVIIIEFYINNKKWEQISEHLNYSIRQCKNIRNKAIENLEKRFDKNNIILKYNFPS